MLQSILLFMVVGIQAPVAEPKGYALEIAEFSWPPIRLSAVDAGDRQVVEDFLHWLSRPDQANVVMLLNAVDTIWSTRKGKDVRIEQSFSFSDVLRSEAHACVRLRRRFASRLADALLVKALKVSTKPGDLCVVFTGRRGVIEANDAVGRLALRRALVIAFSDRTDMKEVLTITNMATTDDDAFGVYAPANWRTCPSWDALLKYTR